MISLNNISEISSDLVEMTYNYDQLNLSENSGSNIYMGIGMWSAENQLSLGLPIDVIHMLLAAAGTRNEIISNGMGMSSRVIILIADSMAEDEGANPEDVLRITDIYQKSIKSLLKILNLDEHSEIICSSELVHDSDYQTIISEVSRLIDEYDGSEVIQNLQENNIKYVRSQTAINVYMNTCKDVGIKIGWIKKPINDNSIIGWDEQRFDQIDTELRESKLQYLYSKGGLKKKMSSIVEGCPYTAYPSEERYLINVGSRVSKRARKVSKIVKTRWLDTIKICKKWMDLGILYSKFLPENCIVERNDVKTVVNAINHWVQAPSIVGELND